MSIFPRYVLRRFFPPFAVCLGALILILFMNKFVRLIALAALKGASPAWILACFALLMPYFLTLTLPTAFLIGSMITLDRFVQDGEFFAARVTGFSFIELTWPLAALALAISVTMLGLDHWVVPRSLNLFHGRYEAVSNRFSRIQPGVLTALGSGRIQVRSVDPKTGWMRDVNLFMRRENRWLIVTAPRAVIIDEGEESTLDLRDGNLQLPNSKELISGTFVHFLVPLQPVRPAVPLVKEPREMTSGELLSRERSVDEVSGRGRYSTELSLRSAAAFAPAVFYWIIVPIFFQLKREKRGRGFAAGLIVLLFYYGFLAVGVVLSRGGGAFESVLYPWLSTIMGLIVGAPLIWSCFY